MYFAPQVPYLFLEVAEQIAAVDSGFNQLCKALNHHGLVLFVGHAEPFVMAGQDFDAHGILFQQFANVNGEQILRLEEQSLQQG